MKSWVRLVGGHEAVNACMRINESINNSEMFERNILDVEFKYSITKPILDSLYREGNSSSNFFLKHQCNSDTYIPTYIL